MKFSYTIERKCCACGLEKKTRSVTGLDPYHRDHINYLCKKCDNSKETIPYLLQWNRKNLPQDRANLFGLTKEEAKKCKIEITIYNPTKSL